MKVYGNKKSDLEISYMLDIPLDKIKSQRREIIQKSISSKTK